MKINFYLSDIIKVMLFPDFLLMGNVSLSPPHICIPLYGVYKYETGDSKGTLSLWQGVKGDGVPLK